MSSSGWPPGLRVLAVRLDSAGDVLMTGPALRALAESGHEVVLLTSPEGAAAAALLPWVSETVVHRAPWMKPPCGGQTADLRLVARLAAMGLDAAVIFTVATQSPLPAALLVYLAGIPRRAAHCRENPYHLLTDWVPEPEPGLPRRHEVARQLALAAAVGAMAGDARLRVRLDEAARRRAAAVVSGMGLAGTRWCLLHPGASAPSRRYPLEGFAAVCELLVAAGTRVLVAVGPAEREDAAVLGALPGVDVAPPVDLAGLAALIEAAPVLVCNNSVPAHLAAAMGTPVVVLYALTNPQHTPWMARARVLSHDVDCRWCFKSVCPAGHHLCLRGVDPREVAAAALELTDVPARGAVL